MPKDYELVPTESAQAEESSENGGSLLGLSDHLGVNGYVATNSTRPRSSRRQSSMSVSATPGLPRTPRTTNRVRFEIQERRSSSERAAPDAAEEEQEENWVEEEDYFSQPGSGRRTRNDRTGLSAPLLTGIEAPSVTVANTHYGADVDDALDNATRPKSGMLSAFTNMANSIM